MKKIIPIFLLIINVKIYAQTEIYYEEKIIEQENTNTQYKKEKGFIIVNEKENKITINSENKYNTLKIINRINIDNTTFFYECIDENKKTLEVIVNFQLNETSIKTNYNNKKIILVWKKICTYI